MTNATRTVRILLEEADNDARILAEAEMPPMRKPAPRLPPSKLAGKPKPYKPRKYPHYEKMPWNDMHCKLTLHVAPEIAARLGRRKA